MQLHSGRILQCPVDAGCGFGVSGPIWKKLVYVNGQHKTLNHIEKDCSTFVMFFCVSESYLVRCVVCQRRPVASDLLGSVKECIASIYQKAKTWMN